MEILGALIVVVIAVGMIALLRYLHYSSQPRSFSPTNDLEHSLAESVGTASLTSQMVADLSSAVLLGLESDEAPNKPMTFSATFPPEFADAMDPDNVTQDGNLQFGPWVVCFSSTDVVDGLAADPVMNGLVTQVGKVREFSSHEIFQLALDEQMDVVLNPFFGVSRRFTQDEIRRVLKNGS